MYHTGVPSSKWQCNGGEKDMTAWCRSDFDVHGPDLDTLVCCGLVCFTCLFLLVVLGLSSNACGQAADVWSVWRPCDCVRDGAKRSYHRALAVPSLFAGSLAGRDTLGGCDSACEPVSL